MTTSGTLPRPPDFIQRRPPGPQYVAGMIDGMTVVRINAITVPADSGDELARRFAARAGAVDSQDGFEGFELLKPTDGRTTWLVVTRWRDDEAFQAWANSDAFGHGHRSASERAGGQAPPPVSTSSELWSFDVAGGSPSS
jgi:heme oxygenase (mycobilin-producing)